MQWIHQRRTVSQAFSSSRVPDDLKSTSPRNGNAADRAGAVAVGAPPRLLALGPAAVQDFTASFALPELTPGAHGMRLELSPRRARSLNAVQTPALTQLHCIALSTVVRSCASQLLCTNRQERHC